MEPANRPRWKMITGMVRPAHGWVELLGTDTESLPPMKARIAYLAEGHPLYTWMTIRDAVAFTLAFYPGVDRTQVDLILDHFGLSPGPRSAACHGDSGPGVAGAGHRTGPGAAHSGRSYPWPRHQRAPPFPRIDDPDHPAPRPDHPVQLPYPG